MSLPRSLIQTGFPYWRLSGFYFFYFAVIGALMPFWGLYLKYLGFSSTQIGSITAVIMATKIIAPNLGGWLADITGQRLQVIRWGALLAWLCFLGVFIKQDFAWVIFLVGIYTFFWNAILAQFEVITLAYLGDEFRFYSRIRLWGSVGFIVAVVLLGVLFDYISIGYLPSFILLFLFLIWLSSCSLRDTKTKIYERHAGGFLALVFQREALCFFAVCFLLQVSHGPYYTFFSVYLVDVYGYSSTTTGLLWGLGALAEVVIFIVMHKLMPRNSLRTLLLWSLLLTALRWILTAYFVASSSILIFAQLLHAFSFGVAHAVCIEWSRQYFNGAQQGQGQALYSAMSFGAGGAVGAFVSGLFWDLSPKGTFIMAASVAMLAFILVYVGMAKPQK